MTRKSYIRHQKMQNITIALPENYVLNIEKLRESGMVPSRSEAIRLAIRTFLQHELQNVKLLGFELHYGEHEK